MSSHILCSTLYLTKYGKLCIWFFPILNFPYFIRKVKIKNKNKIHDKLWLVEHKTSQAIYRIIADCWCPFFESMPKGPYEGKPNEKQGLKTHQEDQRARKVQRNKCKWKQSTAKHKSAAK